MARSLPLRGLTPGHATDVRSHVHAIAARSVTARHFAEGALLRLAELCDFFTARLRGHTSRKEEDRAADKRAQPPRADADTRGVTLPRKLLPGSTYMVTRRVAQRGFLLRPEPLCNQTVEYCFGRALQLYPEIELHALQVLSDHFHAVLTDAGQSLPLFMAWVDREIAKAMNKHRHRAENFWSSDHYSCVELVDLETVWDKSIYVFTNCVRHKLVGDYLDWPGVRSTPQDWLSKPKTIERPEHHFSQKDPRWATVQLRYTLGPNSRAVSTPSFARRVPHESSLHAPAVLRIHSNPDLCRTYYNSYPRTVLG